MAGERVLNLNRERKVIISVHSFLPLIFYCRKKLEEA